MQKVKIECQGCEDVEEYEFDGCLVIGWIPGEGLYLKMHELSVGEIVAQFPPEDIKTCIDTAIETLLKGKE